MDLINKRHLMGPETIDAVQPMPNCQPYKASCEHELLMQYKRGSTDRSKLIKSG